MANLISMPPRESVSEIIMDAFPKDREDEYTPEIVLSAFERIEALGPTAYDGITKLLRGARVKKLLAKIGKPALKYLEYALDHGDEKAQEDALGILGSIGSPSALKMLESVFRNPNLDYRLRQLAAYQIGRNGKIELLDTALTEDDEKLRVAAIAALSGVIMQLLPGEQPDDSHEPIMSAFLKSLEDTNAKVRWHAVHQLGYFGRLTTDMIARALDDKDARVRKEALGVLFKVGVDQSTAPMLAEAIEDVNAEISDLAIENISLYSSYREQIESMPLANAIIDVLVLRTTNLPPKSFNPDRVAYALQQTIALSPPIRGHILTRLCDLAYNHTDSVRTRSVLVARRLGTGDFSALVQERSKEDPSAAKTILQLLGIRSETDAIIHQLSEAAPGDVQKIAASQIELLGTYYDTVLGQARTSFKWALIAAGIGLAFFLGAIAFLLINERQDVAIIGVIGGTIVEVISGINFILYGKTTIQLADFHQRLDRTQRFLLANSICESLEGDVRQKSRSELVAAIATLGLGQHETAAIEQNEAPSS